MILPSMGSGIELSYAQLGYVGTANFVGYLAAVLVARQLAAFMGSRLLTSIALLVAGASMLLMSGAATYAGLVALYCVTGFGSGASNVFGIGQVAGPAMAGMLAERAGTFSEP
jgi:Na+/melibiose symporter-like transporter